MSEVHDPYGGCEADCSHDLARGASAKELRDSDGPYPAEPASWQQRIADRVANRQATAGQVQT